MSKSNDELLLHIMRLEAILNNLPFEVWMKDEKGNNLFSNKKALQSNSFLVPNVSCSEMSTYEKSEKMVYDKSGKPLGIVGYCKENTSNKNNGDMIQIGDQLFRTIFEEAPLGIGIMPL